MTAPSAIRRLNAADADFARHLDHLLSWESVSDDGVNERVLEIIKAVRERGDAAVVELTQRFDALEVASMADLILPRAPGAGARADHASAARGSGDRRRARTQLSRAAETGLLDLHRSRRHGARSERSPARSRRPLRAGRQGFLPIFCADECHPGQGRRRAGGGYGGAHTARRGQ